MGWLDRLHLVLTGWAEDGHAANLCICIRAKNTAQSLFRDAGQCCREVPVPSKVLWMHGMWCKAVAKCALHLSVKVTCSSVWSCCIGSLLPEGCSSRPSLFTMYRP